MSGKVDLSWRMDFGDLITASELKKNLDPSGYDAAMAKDLVSSSKSTSNRKDSNMLGRKQAALWAMALAPAKNIAFMMFMSYMMGNSIQIFSIIMTFSLLSAPVTAMLSSATTFPKEDAWPQLDTLTPRLLFCVVQSGQLLFGLYKLNAMGLLPVHPSDWISVMPVPAALEMSLAALA